MSTPSETPPELDPNEPGEWKVLLPPDMRIVEYFFEPKMQFIQKWIGLDCFFFARIAFLIGCLCGVVTTIPIFSLGSVGFGQGYYGKALPLFISAIFTGAFTIMQWGFMRYGVSFAKQIAYEHLLSGAKNPLLIGHRVFFYLTAIFTPFVIGCMSNPWPVLALNLAFYGTFLSGYIGQALCSCTPLPPGKSKLRQALDAGRVWLESITAPDHPMPEPVGT